jgi:hypothetical protein
MPRLLCSHKKIIKVVSVNVEEIMVIGLEYVFALCRVVRTALSAVCKGNVFRAGFRDTFAIFAVVEVEGESLLDIISCV